MIFENQFEDSFKLVDGSSALNCSRAAGSVRTLFVSLYPYSPLNEA